MMGVRWKCWQESLIKYLEFNAKCLYLAMVNGEPWKVLKNSEDIEAMPENQYYSTMQDPVMNSEEVITIVHTQPEKD